MRASGMDPTTTCVSGVFASCLTFMMKTKDMPTFDKLKLWKTATQIEQSLLLNYHENVSYTERLPC